MNVIYIAGISISLFIAALLLNKKNKSRSDVFLTIWMLVLAFHLFLYEVNFSGSLHKMPHLLGIEIPLPLIHGVFLYGYVSSITNQFPKRPWMMFLHFLPIGVGYGYLIPFFLSSREEKVAFFEEGFGGYEAFMNVGLVLIFLSGIVYVVWCVRLLHRHKQAIQQQFSDIEEVSLSWLQFLTYGLGVIWSIVIFTNNDAYIFAGVTVFAILIGFFGVQQRTIFVSPKQVTVPSQEGTRKTSNEKKKYAGSGLKDELADEIYQKLMRLFHDEAAYKRNELSLNELAADLDAHPNYLSQIINEREGKNFYDFVNSFRLEAFKKSIKDQKHKQLTLLGLAYECGFNSKSSFNRYCKKETGQTPSVLVTSLEQE
ncbi:MAG: helix-turn-helix domain-containing protein [Bacteroidota bacterium]